MSTNTKKSSKATMAKAAQTLAVDPAVLEPTPAVVPATETQTEQTVDLGRYPLEKDAYQFSRMKDEDGRTMQDFVPYGELRALALARGSQISLQELQEMFGRDETAPAGTTCVVTGASFVARRWVIIRATKVLRDRETNQPLLAGNFVARFGRDGKAVALAASGSPFEKDGALNNLRTVKTVHVTDGVASPVLFEHSLPSLTYAAATAKAEALNAEAEQKKADAEAARKKKANAGLVRLGEFVGAGRSNAGRTERGPREERGTRGAYTAPRKASDS